MRLDADEVAERLMQYNSISTSFQDACLKHDELEMHRHYLELGILFTRTLAEATSSVSLRDDILALADTNEMLFDATFTTVNARLDEVRKKIKDGDVNDFAGDDKVE